VLHVQYINRRYGRTGTLWDSRYRSSLVQEDAYLFACHRYIEMNPVRAGIVGDPAQYRWSSYRANGLGQLDAQVTPHPLYGELGRDDRERQAAYRALFDAGLDLGVDGIRLALSQNQPLGNAKFHAKVEQVTGNRREARPRGRPRGCALGI
jgi:putative transposase